MTLTLANRFAAFAFAALFMLAGWQATLAPAQAAPMHSTCAIAA